MSRVLLALAADPLDGLERLIIVVALFELAGGLLLAGILFANVRRLVHGRPDVGLGSVGVGAGVLELSVFFIFRGGGSRLATVALAVGIASLLAGLLNMVRGRSSSAP